MGLFMIQNLGLVFHGFDHYCCESSLESSCVSSALVREPAVRVRVRVFRVLKDLGFRVRVSSS
jgi:hypothetical protein